MRAKVVFLCWFACIATLLVQTATAAEQSSSSDEAEQAAAALFAQAEGDEAAGDYASALAHYKEVYGRAPSSRYAQRAMNRADVLRTHSEGNFGPFAKVERVRRDPGLANDAGAIDALARDAEQFPPGPTRAEARMLVAEAYLGRMGRHGDAIEQLRKAATDPKADVLLARQAAREIVETDIADGNLEAARAEARALATRLDPKLVIRTERLIRRHRIHLAALVDLMATLGFAAIAVVMAKRRDRLDAVVQTLRRTWPVAVAFAAFVALAGGALASSYESGNATPFRAFGLAVVPLVLVARAWGAAGSPRPLWRTGRAVACACATFASAFVVLEAIDPTYLDGFGL